MLIAWLEQGHVAIAILCALDEALLCTSHLRRKMPGISKVLQGSPSTFSTLLMEVSLIPDLGFNFKFEKRLFCIVSGFRTGSA